jgi:hypothetical protein
MGEIMTKGKWLGSPPKECDLCHKPIIDQFVDGRTVYGPWANMCLRCHKKKGVGLGTGFGQYYKKNQDGDFMKAEG